jgi:hypothetical protein
MNDLTRRDFARISAALAMAQSRIRAQGAIKPPTVEDKGKTIEVVADGYSWRYNRDTDLFQLIDSRRRTMVSGRLQPVITVAAEGSNKSFSAGHLEQAQVESGKVTFEYQGVNGQASVSLTWRFEAHRVWLEPITYNSKARENVVSAHYFADLKEEKISPSLTATYLVVPGISEGSSLSPIVRDTIHLDETVWLGRGSPVPGLLQQWGLPVHFFCGFNIQEQNGLWSNAFSTHLSDSFVCGLAELPNGDLFLDLNSGKSSMWVDYRGDLWKHMQTPDSIKLGARLLWCFGANYYEAIAHYYLALLDSGIIPKKSSSQTQTAAALAPQFCTWGAQVAQARGGDKLDEAFLRKLYSDMKSSGMQAAMFSIDDKWEGTYGNLEHSEKDFPHFIQFLDQIRADGKRVGLWAALMRCERPADLGLTEDNVLKQPDGSPYVASEHPKYFILDFTQPEVATVLKELARKFMRRYKPDLVKFDFGYELPPVSKAAPKDKQWAGERMMWKGLDVVIRAMREVNPDLVVMYYQLSPFFIEFFDLHSSDDMFLAAGEYDLEANRRFFFSSLLGRLGVPTYGSSGYDCASAPNIWFDSAAIGTIGLLSDPKADEQGGGLTADDIARYNGIARVLRQESRFDILPLGVEYEASSRGAHARSWARFEQAKLVLLAYRPVAPGDENRLAQAIPPEIQSAVQSTMPVIVASQDRGDLASCSRLGLVPYSDGKIAVRRAASSRATIMHHYFGGKSERSNAKVRGGLLALTVERRSSSKEPLEWIEVNFA